MRTSQVRRAVKIQSPSPIGPKSSATATDDWLSNGTMIIEFHFLVKTERAVAVGCGDLLGACMFSSEEKSLSYL
jgi:hypothetical protein